ncbi:MFS transporter, VNT family, synaptic vesicle glycoprotein 2 [Fistulifera solaris]|uniref:MFS transporter, VNT family, synaptic vesicle glycoprotein 2 n=1 Tax=Fistulifera solaris TaxID=1519565 RepID=A0A1Z5KL00_FISSO|nr:MFS transporter, VNT family, synaptic vesicle glycoprotein 2 [Fistulifera solaris]|eukprot:GAX26867.1 MFS transporter, VNT family, synaptic vesicle glycoprotein 2 [Fistulifera solaris]
MTSLSNDVVQEHSSSSTGDDETAAFHLNHHSDHSSLRSIDQVLEQALPDKPLLQQWRYWVIFLSLGVANSSDAAEILGISYILSNATFDEHILGGSASKASLLAATVFAGMLFGGLIVGGGISDVVGRRPVLLFGLALNSVAGLLSAAAWNVYSLSFLRFVAGIGIGTTIPPLFTLCSELAPPQHRGLCVTLAASFWMVGSMYVAILAWWGQGNSWRVFAMTCAIPSAVGWWLVQQSVPESPRFLLLQGRYDEAVLVVRDLTERAQFQGLAWTLEEAQAHGAPILTQRALTWGLLRTSLWNFGSSAQQLYLPETRQVTLALQLVWFGLSFGTYGLYTWINKLFLEVHLQNVYFNALLFSASNLPGNLLSAFLMDRIGRSKMLVGSTLASVLSLMVFAYVVFRDESAVGLSDSPPLPVEWIVLASCAFQMCTIVSWNTIDVLTSELFPTFVRATGMGVCAGCGRIGAMLAQFINGALVVRPVSLLLVAAFTLLIAAIMPIFLPADQTGHPVRDTVSEKRHRKEDRSSELTVRAPHRNYSYQHLDLNGQLD